MSPFFGGFPLPGVERVLEQEAELERMHARIEQLELEALHAQVKLAEELEQVRRSFRAELAVPYRGGTELVRAADARSPLRAADARSPFKHRTERSRDGS
jgi:acetyl-CoA carboxylase alpha subunit